jgi:HK97 family phage prohead protease
MAAEFADPSQRFALCSCLYATDSKAIALDRLKRADFGAATLKQLAEAPASPDEPPPRLVEAVISTSSVDRDGESVVSEGCDYGPYMANPVVLLDHDPGKIVAVCRKIAKSRNAITATLEFPRRPAGVDDWLPDQAYAQARSGLLRGVSIGFLVREQRKPTARDRATFGEECKSVISKFELVEITLTPTPANDEAVVYAVKSVAPAATDTPPEPTPAEPTPAEPEPAPKFEPEPEPAPEPVAVVQKVLGLDAHGRWVLRDQAAPTPDPAATTAIMNAAAAAVAAAVRRALGRLY